jgi:hypothetical protein
MTRTIVLAAPSQQLKQVVGFSAGKRIYPRSHPVWEDQDLRREKPRRIPDAGQGVEKPGATNAQQGSF